MRKSALVLAVVVGIAPLGAATASATAAVAATGTIIVVRGGELLAGDTFTIDDGAGAPRTFEFTQGTPSGSDVAVGFGSGDTTAAVRDHVISAINAASLGVTASSGGGAVVRLVNAVAGPTGNRSITQGAGSPLTVLGMSGGADAGGLPGAAPATGTVVVVPGSELNDGESFTVDDGAGGTTTFEFTPAAATGGAVAVSFGAGDSATTVRNKVITAINSSALAVTATAVGSRAVALVADVAGAAGNVPMTAVVGDADFTVLGMAGGRDADTAPPTDAPVVSGGATGSNGWYTGDVTVAWNWSDADSGIDPLHCAQTSGSTGEGTAVPVSSSCQDAAGNATSDSRTFPIDQTAPVVGVTGVSGGAGYLLGSVPTAGCSTGDPVSGVATAATPSVTTSGTNGVGPFTATCAGAVDVAGNAAPPVSAGYTVAYPFTGFLQPVDNAPVVNVTAAGTAIPVRFRLGGDRGLGVLAAGSPTSQPMTCSASARLDKVEQTVTARSSSFTYVPSKGWYVYTWKTSASWAHSCRRLDIRLGDGTDHIVYVKLT